MSKETIGERLERVRKLRKYGSAADAARATGIPLGTYNSYENGHREPGRERIVRLAKFFKVSPSWLLTGNGEAPEKLQAEVVGYVGQGAELIRVSDTMGYDDLKLVPPPPGVTEPCEAARIQGDAMYPFEDGWLVFWAKDPQGVPGDCLGRLCAVKLTDGRTLLKKLHRGTVAGRYRLDGINTPAIEDANVEWATRVLGITTG